MSEIEVDVNQVKQLFDSESEFLLIDCREPDEHETCRIEGSVLIPMRELPDRIAELEAHREQRIVVHCHHGGRSLRVVHWLRDHGFEHAQNMTGGIDVWSQQIDPTVPQY